MSDLEARMEIYSDPDMIIEIADPRDVADVIQCAVERIAELEVEVKSIRQARANFLEASADRPQAGGEDE